jgi:hypothetical protein
MFEIETRGLEDMIAKVKEMPGDIDEALQLSINDSARLARREGAKQILEEVNYPRSYLRGEGSRLSISQFATRSNPEAVVTGRDRATSLARFATSKPKFGRQRGVKVKVSTDGATQQLHGGFFLRLNNGNVGLAVRTRKGERLRNSRAAVALGNGAYLLYGPSVNQVFQGVAADIVDRVSDNLETQFLRQFLRLNDGR